MVSAFLPPNSSERIRASSTLQWRRRRIDAALLGRINLTHPSMTLRAPDDRWAVVFSAWPHHQSRFSDRLSSNGLSRTQTYSLGVPSLTKRATNRPRQARATNQLDAWRGNAAQQPDAADEVGALQGRFEPPSQLIRVFYALQERHDVCDAA